MATSAKTKSKTKKAPAKTPVKRSTRATTARKASSTPRKKTAPKTVSRQAPARATSRKAQPAPRSITISPQRKVDITGIGLIVVGVLTLLSLVIGNAGVVSKWWSDLLYKAAGWGAYAAPVILILAGAWFLLRNLEQFPDLSGERMIGIILAFFNALAWFQLISQRSGAPGASGGGAAGRFILDILSRGFGRPGAVILLIAWLLICLVLLVDFSMSDLTLWLAERLKDKPARFARFIKSKAAALQAKRAGRSEQSFDEEPEQAETAPEPASPKRTAAPSPQTTPSAAGGGHAWALPDPEEVLLPSPAQPPDQENDQDRARVIEETLRSFNTPSRVVEIRRGPAVTMFGVEPDFVESRNGKKRVRVSNIVSLADDLALALKASRIRVQAPVPGRGYIGIEVPNSRTSIVSMQELVESPGFRTNPNPLKFPLGKNVAGQPFTTDLADMPHLLIAGTTGSGKSVCVNAMLASYLLTLTPDQIRFVLVDPKRVELTGYNGIPHLLAPVIVDAEKVVGALQWMQREMDLRYRIFAEANVRNITEYNNKQSAAGGKTLPFYLIVIDELADLMLLAPTETEKLLTRLAQLARATGIHLVLATQRPSVDIITGLIKANFPARIAFAVASMTDSRVIIDQPGAESLLSKGDMLFQAPDSPAPVRLQGTFISETELNRLVDFWRNQAQQKTAEERPDIAVFASQSRPPLVDDGQTQPPLWQETSKNSDEDPLTTEVIRIIRHEGRASVSLLQRKLRIGYSRSARIIESLEERGIVGPPNPQTGTREVLDYGEYGPLDGD